MAKSDFNINMTDTAASGAAATGTLLNILDKRAARRKAEGKVSLGPAFVVVGGIVGSLVGPACGILGGIVLGVAGAILAGVVNYLKVRKDA